MNAPEVLLSADISHTPSALRRDNLDNFYIKTYTRFCAYERSYPFSAHVIPIPLCIHKWFMKIKLYSYTIKIKILVSKTEIYCSG